MKYRPQYYGWYEQKTKEYRMSRFPPDATARPSLKFQTLAELTAALEQRRAQIYWWPPLTENQLQ
jgi:hypothetical protein